MEQGDTAQPLGQRAGRVAAEQRMSIGSRRVASCERPGRAGRGRFRPIEWFRKS